MHNVLVVLHLQALIDIQLRTKVLPVTVTVVEAMAVSVEMDPATESKCILEN